MTNCLHCSHFKQQSNHAFTVPGECGWMPSGPVASWLRFYINDDDPYYGAKKKAHRGFDGSTPVFHVDSEIDCPVFREASKKTIKKRMSDEWYEVRRR